MTPERIDAIVELLALPDPPELPERGHHLTVEGDPRRQERLLQMLPLVYVQHMRPELEPEEE